MTIVERKNLDSVLAAICLDRLGLEDRNRGERRERERETGREKKKS